MTLFGYYYYITDKKYSKIYVKNFYTKCENKEDKLNKFIENMYDFIKDKKLLKELRDKCKKEDLKEFFEEEDIIRYLFKLLEQKIFNNEEKKTFLNEIFELYAPIWIPIPREYHYEYWKSLIKIQDKLEDFIKKNVENYKVIRDYFISELSKKILIKYLQNVEIYNIILHNYFEK